MKKKAKKGSAKGRRKASAVKDLPARKAGSVKGGFAAADKPAGYTVKLG